MNISKEAIEAAENAYPSGEDEARRRGIESTSHYFGMKAALEAAAPLLMAQAWNEGAKAMKRAVSEEQSVSFIMPNNPYRKERP